MYFRSHWHGALAVALLLAVSPARAQDTTPPLSSDPAPPRHRLPFLAEEARKRGIELPRTYGVGLVYYALYRDIEITEVRVGRNGATPVPVPDFAVFGATSDVSNLNLKVDVWILPFLNVYAIVGGIQNESATSLDLILPGVIPGGGDRNLSLDVPTEISGSVAGLGITLAGGYRSFFAAADINGARADLGFDDRFKALVSSLRAGWHGEANERPIRVWVNATSWDTFATAKGTVVDPDGGTLSFEVDQGPAYQYTYGAGMSYSPTPSWELSADFGSDFHGGWYVAIVPVFRF